MHNGWIYLICVPYGFSADGLRLSLQLATKQFDQPLLFRVGHACQQMTDWHLRHPTEGLTQ